jgi:hypothetical protein
MHFCIIEASANTASRRERFMGVSRSQSNALGRRSDSIN